MKFIASLLLLVLFSNSIFAEKNQHLELLDVFNLEYVSDPQISPNGKQIIYTRHFKDVMTDKNHSNLWIIDFDGKNNRPLTTGNHSARAAKWSHDGKKIVYLSDHADDKTKLYVMWMDSRDSAPLTNSKYPPAQVSWSRDDKHLVFTQFVPKAKKSLVQMPTKPKGAQWNKPPIYIDDMNYRADGRGFLPAGNRQIFSLPIDGGTPRQLTDSAHNHQSPIFSADKKSVFFTANLHEDHEFEPLNAEIYRLDLTDLSIKALTSRFGPDGNAQLSPDGKKLAYVGFDDTFQGHTVRKLYVMDADGNNQKLISSELDRSVQSMAWAANSKGLYVQYTDRGDGKLALVKLNGSITDVAEKMGGLSLGRPYNAAAFSVAENNRVAFTYGGTEHPADLAVVNNKKVRRLTQVNADLFDHKALGEVEELWWQSSIDQRQVQGWLVKPPHFDPNKKYPLILEIHGGPFASYGSVFSAEVQLFAAAGYVVLYANPRGSTGYGQEFANLIHHDYPNNDYHDLMSGVDKAIESGYVDADQLFVTGGSGGGVLTAWIVGHTDRFKAAVVAKPVINWISFVLYADNPGFFYKYWFPNKPWEDTENYLKRSPLSYVGNVTTPTMLLTGEEDFRTPIAESEQYYSALKLQKVESAMVRIPGASHGIASRPSNLVAKVASILAWFEKYRTAE
ncbi:S9 family peptidase [Marinicella sp. S1101]|uniref:S9 family peptidase n=1 Tax=Marinicella marina TaxID=2996016 RepID=UPI002260E103|nr:S9 family peptidase [Marinicella marina]MCX7554908.1 S9 family peptidase [Marinicella marina]MDJ1141268.1 S9 family peptidase [Marinicella marina]